MTITQEQLQTARHQALAEISRETLAKNKARNVLDALRQSKADQREKDAAAAAYREAYDRWRTYLITEHKKGLLQPLQIYRAAGITKQMFAKLRANAARGEATTTTAAHIQLPPDQEQLPPAAAADNLFLTPERTTH